MYRNAILTVMAAVLLASCGEDIAVDPRSNTTSVSGGGAEAIIANSDGSFTSLLSEGCSKQTLNRSLETAFTMGDIQYVARETELFDDMLRTIDCSKTQFNQARREIFGLDADGNLGPNGLGNITWDPTWDTGLLAAVEGESEAILVSNATFDADYAVRSEALGVIGQTDSARHMVLGSNPMRTQYRRRADAGQINDVLKNAIGWMTQREVTRDDPLRVVIAQTNDGYWFPDERANRAWFDTHYADRVTYNDADTCDGSALADCLAAEPDLLIISQDAEGGDVSDTVATVRAAIARGQAVLYMHWDGGLTDLGREILPLLGARYIGDNYWRRQMVEGLNGADSYGEISPSNAALRDLLTRLRDDNFGFDFSDCTAKNGCPSESLYYAQFNDTTEMLRGRMNDYDKAGQDVFALNGHRIDKGLVLLADKIREDVRFPMDMHTTPRDGFLRAIFADSIVHTARKTAPAQADLGNFSRTDFSHVTPVTRDVTLTAREYFSATGVYALPGQTVRVTRRDSADVQTEIRVNLIRSGATHEFESFGYNRPKFLASADMPIAPGETVSFTSVYGGPIQIRFHDKDMETQFTFENIGEHAIWRGPEDDVEFSQKLIAGDFDWAELITPSFQVHSKLDKMRETVEHPAFTGAAAVAAATQRHLHNLPHVLAGFQGDGIDDVPEIHDFAATNGLTIDTLDIVKHMNADQATCGYGCSGNPYDAYWNFNPIGHGDIHELGHGLERGRFRYTGQVGHTSTNPYSYYSKSRFYADTGNSNDLGCQSLPYQTLFETVQASQTSDDPAQYMRDAALTNWNYGAGINLQIMMGVQDLGLLDNGYHLLARQHIIERNFNRAIKNDDLWAEQKDGLGFGDFTRDAARNLTNNDFNLLALSHAIDRDMTDYLERWGFELSGAAKASVADKIDFPTDFYISGDRDHCMVFPTEKLPMDGAQSWPAAAQISRPMSSVSQMTQAPLAAGHICSEDEDDDHAALR